jgi:glutathione synthase/RimK-type ligase-like ATP-grasp enzyme
VENVASEEFSWRPPGSLRVGEHDLRQDACAGLFRRPGTPQLDRYDTRYARFLVSEVTDAFYGALSSLHVRWLSNPQTMSLAELKLVQLEAAFALGIPFPQTVVTNRASAAIVLGDALVVKPVRYGLLTTEPSPLVAYTEAATSGDLKGLSGSPIIVQERVTAAFHLRVTTVGPDAFVAALRAGDDVDWRKAIENHSRFRVSDLPEGRSVADAALRLAERLGLGMSAQDWVLTPDGATFFLEANPNGQWLFLDDVFDPPLSMCVATRLLQLRDQVS